MRWARRARVHRRLAQARGRCAHAAIRRLKDPPCGVRDNRRRLRAARTASAIAVRSSAGVSSFPHTAVRIAPERDEIADDQRKRRLFALPARARRDARLRVARAFQFFTPSMRNAFRARGVIRPSKRTHEGTLPSTLFGPTIARPRRAAHRASRHRQRCERPGDSARRRRRNGSRHPPQAREEERHADQRGHCAKWKLGRRAHGPRDDIGGDHEQRRRRSQRRASRSAPTARPAARRPSAGTTSLRRIRQARRRQQ